MKKILKTNFISFLLLLIILISVNSFIHINENFFKTEVRVQIKSDKLGNDFENLVYKKIFETINVEAKSFDDIIKKINTDYFGVKILVGKLKKKNSSYSLNSEHLKYNGLFLVYKKFPETDYTLFFNKNFDSFLIKNLATLREKKIIEKKKLIIDCFIKNILENPNEESYNTKKNLYEENYSKFIAKLNEIYGDLYTSFLPKKVLEESLNLSVLKENKSTFLKCIKIDYSDYFYLSNLDNFDYKNFNYDIKFNSYNNYKLIYFINLIIIMTFILVFFSFNVIFNNFVLRVRDTFNFKKKK